MVWNDAVSQDAGALIGLPEHSGGRVGWVPAPCLLAPQGVGSPAPWQRLRRSVELAETLGAPIVVVHPPFTWQRDYARGFAAGLRKIVAAHPRVSFAIENMYPVRMAGREFVPYSPGWDPTVAGFDAYTLDLSHCAASRSNALARGGARGPRRAPVPPGGGPGGGRDERGGRGGGGRRGAGRLESRGRGGSRGAGGGEVPPRRSASRAEREA